MKPAHRFRPTRLSLLLVAGFAAAAAQAQPTVVTYPGDPGKPGDPASWRTPEFQRSFGLRAMGTEFAYAAGYAGLGIRIGLMDSGFFFAHPDLPASRFTPVTVNGVDNTWNRLYNDSHGTSVAGQVGASRDGNATTNIQGVAINAQIFMGNTLKGDGALFGIPQATQSVAQTIDQAYIANAYRAVAAVPGQRIVGTSWGSQPNTEHYQTLLPTTQLFGTTNLTGRAGAYGAWAYLTRGDTWFSGALDAHKTGVAINFSNGNSGYVNSSARAGAAYFDPTLEARWTAVTGIRETLNLNGTAVGTTYNADGSVNVPGVQVYNQCGYAKWSCVSAPSVGSFSTNVTNIANGGTAGTGGFSGTSSAQPHATGALGIIMQRFGYMTNEQAVSVMRTTATQNATINDANGVQIVNPNAGKIVQTPDDRNGWGTVSLKNAMNGPGQFMGNFAVDTQGQSDTWSNNISDVAIQARRAEDQAEAAAWEARKAEKGWTTTPPAAPPAPPSAAADQQAYYASAAVNDYTEYQVGMARQAAREGRVYEGSLSKLGAGTLALTGDNSFSGGTRIFAGGVTAGSATAMGTGDVDVFGGTFATRSLDTVKLGGDLTIGAAGMLDLGLGGGMGGRTPLLLDVAGNLTFLGALNVSFLEGFAGIGTYDLIDWGSFTGSFSNFVFTGLHSAYTASLLYTADGLALNVAAIPEPETYAMLLAGLGVLGWTARRRQRAAARRG